MIKGVTKSVIELKPKNSCFEKVIIILNSGCELPDTEELRREAELLTGKVPDFIRHKYDENADLSSSRRTRDCSFIPYSIFVCLKFTYYPV